MALLKHYTPQEQTLARYLNRLAAILMIVCLAGLILPYVLAGASFFIAPPFFVTNSLAGLALLACLAWLAAGDVRRFRPLIRVLIAGFLVGAGACLALYLSPLGDQQPAALLIGFAIMLVLTLGLTWFAYQAQTEVPPWLPWLPDKPQGQWEGVARVVFGLFGLASVTAAAGSILLAYLDPSAVAPYYVQPLMVAGSTIKIGVLGLCALHVAWDVRRYIHHSQMVTILILGHAASFVAIVFFALFGYAPFGDYNLAIDSAVVTLAGMMLGAGLLDVVIIPAFWFLKAQTDRYTLNQLEFFNGNQFRALEATAETLVTGEDAATEEVPPHEIAQRTDRYLRSFRSSRLWLAGLAAVGLQLFPLIWLKPPINYLNPYQRRDFIDLRFKQEIIDPPFGYRLLDRLLLLINRLLLVSRGRPQSEASAALSFTGLLEAMLRFNMQLAYLGYYNSPEIWPVETQSGHKGIGYMPFSKRAENSGLNLNPLRPHPPMTVETPDVLEAQGIDTISDADVVIIGSGAAGAILAEQLAAKGRRVLLLEKGLYVHPDDFSEDEVEMLSNLYSDGALQIAQSLRFTIIQGSCVGGSTVVNNAVCFDTPTHVLDRWNERGSGQAIDPARFYASQQAVRDRLRVRPVLDTVRTRQENQHGSALNHGDDVIGRGVKAFLGENGNHEYDVVQANIVDCLGCGYCNIGCKYGRKLSMLDEVLPAAQHKHGADNFRIISEAEVVRLKTSGGKVTGIEAGIQGKRSLLIDHPNTVIVSAGTIASSWILMQSEIGQGKLPVGQGLSFNMGSPLHGWFGQKIDSFDGLQIAHYLRLKDQPGFVYETWYNPPVAQSLAMPGWLDTHFQNMRHYDEIAAVGVLVGTESNAYVTKALLTGGPDVVYQPTQNDLNKLVDALVILGEIMFAGGAKEVYASTRSYHHYAQQLAAFAAVERLAYLRELVQGDYDILLGTGHPQGGNAIGTVAGTDGKSGSVVGPDFKVFGYDNLYVCDASVFPSSTTVNPQLTVMTMAHYAAQVIDQ